MSMLLNPINKIVLARFAGLGSIPIYDLSFTGCMRIRNVFDSSQRAIVPEVGRMFAYSREIAMTHARRVTIRSLRMMLWALPAYLVLIAGAPLLLQFWLGNRYDPGSPLVVRIMLIGAYGSLIGMPAYYMLIGVGDSGSVLVSTIIQLGVNLSLIACSMLLFSSVSPVVVVISTSAGMICATGYLILRFLALTKSVAMPLTAEPAVSVHR